MNQYNISYNKTLPIVLAMILPSCIIPFFIYFMAKYMPNLSDWTIGTIIASILLLIIVATLAIIKKLDRKGVLTLNSDGFIVEFNETNSSLLPSFEIKIADIISFHPHIKQANFYMSFTTSIQPSRFNICPTTRKEEDVIPFIQLMQDITKMVEDKSGKEVDFS